MTSNSQLKQKNIYLKMENSNLLELRFALMSDNRRLEAERDNLQTHLDLSAQALDAVTAERDNLKVELEVLRHLHETTENFTIRERDEARAWARRMKRERDEARDLLGMMDVDKIVENLEKMRRWLK